MSEPKPEATLGSQPGEAGTGEARGAAETARVRETIGAGLRTFYEAVLDEPIPAEWFKLVSDEPPKDSG